MALVRAGLEPVADILIPGQCPYLNTRHGPVASLGIQLVGDMGTWDIIWSGGRYELVVHLENTHLNPL